MGVTALTIIVALSALASAPKAITSLARFVTCASGSLALAALGVATLGGIALRAGLPGALARRIGGSGLTRAHQHIAAGATVLTVIHLGGAFATPNLGVGWLQLVVPFTRAGGPAAVIAHGFAVIAAYVLATIVITTAMRKRLPWAWWKRVHLLAVPLFALAAAHTVLVECWATPWAGPSLVSTAMLAGAVPMLRVHLPTPAPVGELPAGSPSNPASLALQDPQVPPPAGTLALLIAQMTWEAQDVMSLRLVDPAGSALPAWTPGAHLEVALPSGKLRYYSLYSDPADRGCYKIAILRQDAGRGGSREIHDAVRLGRRLPVSSPRNTFPLKQASSYLFIAGGIGITAVLPMARVVARRGGRWWLLYAGKSRSRMALIPEALELDSRRVMICPADAVGRPDLSRIINRLPPGCAVYCCGPERMIIELDELVSARTDVSLHVEHFGGASATGGAAVSLQLRRSARTVEVSPDQSLLDAVRDLAPALTGGCEAGVCGRCRATVLEGNPDHRDILLSPAERAGGQILLCVSRAHGQLVLDL